MLFQCASCQNPIENGLGIRVVLEKYTRAERTWFACSEECAQILYGH